MAVTLKDEFGRLGDALGSIVTVSARVDRFGAVAGSADARLEDAVETIIAELEGPDGWPTVIPRAEVEVARVLEARFGLTIVADTTPDPDAGRPSTDPEVIY